MMTSKAVRVGMAACAAVALAGSAARAYIPSVNWLLRRAAARAQEGGRSRDTTMSGMLTLGQAPPLAATLALRFPLACRFEAAGLSVTVKGEAGQQQIQEDGHDSARDLLKLACPLIAYRGQSTAAAERTLRLAAMTAGLTGEFSPVSLSRLYDRVAVVLGAPPRQLEQPQLWFYKENTAPARLLARTADSRLDDLRLLQYGSPAAADWLPRVVELWHAGQLVARFEALETHGLRDVVEEGGDDERER
jgi:hypothetical protein